MSACGEDRGRRRALAVEFSGPCSYRSTWKLQQRLWDLRRRLEWPDTLLLLEHAPVITIGRHGDRGHILAAPGVAGACPEVVAVDRGGDVTYHGPGQLTAYFICDLHAHDLGVRGFVARLEEVVIRTLAVFGLRGSRRPGLTGVWLRDERGWAKAAALGVRIARGVSLHGVALNVAGCLAGFRGIVPCGLGGERVTELAEHLPQVPRMTAVAGALREAFAEAFHLGWRAQVADALGPDDDPEARVTRWQAALARDVAKPDWLRMGLPGGESFIQVRRVIAAGRLHTVCESARCPNQRECWNAGTATFLILGARCSRDCRFCAVAHGVPGAPDPEEPERVAAAAAALGLRHVVVTSVTRDDLPDGGAAVFAATLRALRARCPRATTEVLIPDFGGDPAALDRVLDAGPTILNHNVETVARLYRAVRPGADYARSLALLRRAAGRAATKSGLMLGLGEGDLEIREVLRDLRAVSCAQVTIGQYLQPSRGHLPVHRYATPAEFAGWRRLALEMGFARVQAGALVRSSYRAAGEPVEEGAAGDALGTAR